jgi:hypothetical protein
MSNKASSSGNNKASSFGYSEGYSEGLLSYPSELRCKG